MYYALQRYIELKTVFISVTNDIRCPRYTTYSFPTEGDPGHTFACGYCQTH